MDGVGAVAACCQDVDAVIGVRGFGGRQGGYAGY